MGAAISGQSVHFSQFTQSPVFAPSPRAIFALAARAPLADFLVRIALFCAVFLFDFISSNFVAAKTRDQAFSNPLGF